MGVLWPHGGSSRLRLWSGTHHRLLGAWNLTEAGIECSKATLLWGVTLWGTSLV